MKTPIVVAVTILALIAGFAGGYFFRNYQLSRLRSNFTGQFQRPGGAAINQDGNQMARLGGRPIVGEIISQDEKSITVKMEDESTKIVILSDSTIYSKTDTGNKDDLEVSSQVGVFGTENSDGSITAQNVQLNPQFSNFMGGQR